MKFTQKTVDDIKHKDKRQWIRDDVVKGLMLVVGTKSSKGTKTWYFNYRDMNGKKGSRKIGDAHYIDVIEARKIAKSYGGQVAKGESIRTEKPADKLTLGSYLNENYFPHARTANKSAKGIIRVIINAFEYCFDKPIDELTPAMIDKWRQSYCAGGRTAATANRATTYLKAAINHGVKTGLLEKNPIAGLQKLKERDSKYIVRYLSDDERERLEITLIAREDRIRRERETANQWRRERGYETKPDIKGMFTDHLRPMVLLTLATGIRRGALLALQWGDIDFNSETITLRAEDDKGTKTNRLPLSGDAVYILSAWYKQSENTAPDDLIFPSPVTGHSIQEIKTAWKNILRDAKIENFRWHDMRHDFASQLVMRGIDLNTVRELLTHSDMKMTLRYAHLAPEHKQRAVQILDRMTKGNKIVDFPSTSTG